MFSSHRLPLKLLLISSLMTLCEMSLSAQQSGETATQPPDEFHTVLVHTTQSHGMAEDVVAGLGRDGYSPVLIDEDGFDQRVCFGRFSTYLEARMYKDFFVESERFPEEDLDVLLLRNAAQDSVGENQGRMRIIFELDETPLSWDPPMRFDEEGCPIGAGGINRGFFPVIPEIEDQPLLAEIEAGIDDPDRGAQIYQEALRRAPNTREQMMRTRVLALPIAQAHVAAPPDVRFQAMWLMARVYHAMGWRRTAYRAYEELKTLDLDPRDRARCLVEQAGLTMEQARHHSDPLGTMADCRRACQRVLDEFSDSEDPEIRQHSATASLMAAETFFHESDWDQAAYALVRVVRDYHDVPRERAMARYFLAQTYHRQHLVDEALQVFEELGDMRLGPEDNFPNRNISAEGYEMGIVVAIEAGHTNLAQRFFQDLAETYPNSEPARISARRIQGVPDLTPRTSELATQVIGQ